MGKSSVTSRRDLNAEFAGAWRALRSRIPAWVPDPVAEHRFEPSRKWAFDFAWPQYNVAVELNGWGHRTLERTLQDDERLNWATERGWLILRYSSQTVKAAPASIIEQLMRTLDRRLEQLERTETRP